MTFITFFTENEFSNKLKEASDPKLFENQKQAQKEEQPKEPKRTMLTKVERNQSNARRKKRETLYTTEDGFSFSSNSFSPCIEKLHRRNWLLPITLHKWNGAWCLLLNNKNDAADKESNHVKLSCIVYHYLHPRESRDIVYTFFVVSRLYQESISGEFCSTHRSSPKLFVFILGEK